MKNIIVLVCLGFIIYSCSSDNEPKKRTRSAFGYTTPSHLYFKNMRSFHYNEETRQKQGLSIYRLKKLENSPVEPNIKPAIYINWLKDEAYLMFEDSLNVIVPQKVIQTVSSSKDTMRYTLKNNDFLGQQKFANDLLKKHQKSKINLMNENQANPILEDQFIRNQALIVIADYMKLIE